MNARVAAPDKGRHPYLPLPDHKRTGATVAGLTVPLDTAERFTAACTAVNLFDCRVYVSRQRGGFQISDVYHSTQQAAWRIFKGTPPRVIATTCDTPNCVNPDHLIGSDWCCPSGHPRLREWSKVAQRRGGAEEVWVCLFCHLARFETCSRGHDLDEYGRIRIRPDSGRRYRVCMECIRLVRRQRRTEHPERHAKALAARRERYAKAQREQRARQDERRAA